VQINERADRLECSTAVGDGAALFEENCEQTWEKGSSGLVFHTDDAHWDAAQGDFHERTADALDVLPGDSDAQCDEQASAEDPAHILKKYSLQWIDCEFILELALTCENACQDAAFLESWQRSKTQMIRGRRQGAIDSPQKALGLPPALRRQSAARGHDSLALAVSGVQRAMTAAHAEDARADGAHGRDATTGRRGYSLKGEERILQDAGRKKDCSKACADLGGGRYCEDSFDRDVRRGFAGQLCEKMGWREGEGLGANGDLGVVKG